MHQVFSFSANFIRALNAADKYTAFPKLHLPGRTWPEKELASPPRWLSTDLRDGNQALAQPMDVDAKFRYFQMLLELGYKEIEISYPSASQTEYDFTRRIITTPGVVPDDVWIQVMAPCRPELIRKTIESVRGAKKIILHIHMSTSGCFRDIVFNMTEAQQIDLAKRCIKMIRELTKDSDDLEMRSTEWVLEFTAENFQDTSLRYALEICEAVMKVWEPTEKHKIIFNLPSTVEMAMPNVFADQIEYFSTHIPDREKVCVSLHCHNDRGTAVAATELAQLAGADRVEGCLFGNGERTGNVDLVTLAMNLHTQGVNSGINFGFINDVVSMVEELTRIPVHYRAPYAGKLVFCTYTGTHQDAIRKGYQRRALEQKALGRPPRWVMPYLPMDPSDLGKKHEAVIRINSQSGKGGVGWYIDEIFNISMPREMEVAFTEVVKAHADDHGIELSHSVVEDLFRKNYMLNERDLLKLLGCYIRTATSGDALVPLRATKGSETMELKMQCSESNIMTNILEFVKHLGFYFDLMDHETQLIEVSGISATLVRLHSNPSLAWGVGIHKDPIWSTLQAVMGAVNHLAV